MTRNNKNGFTMPEIALGIVAAAFLTLMAGQGLRLATKSVTRGSEKLEYERTLTQLATQILTVGRLAENCTLSANPTTIQCQIKRTPQAPPMTIRFVERRDHLVQQGIEQNGTVSQTIYPQAQFVYLCGDADMTTQGRCALVGPTKINEQHSTNRTVNPAEFSTPPNRFFRFRIAIKAEPRLALQSAFFVRNGTEGMPHYNWGSME